MSTNDDYDITYTPCEKPTGVLRGVPSKSHKLDGGWVTNLFECDDKFYVRAVKFEGPEPKTKWMEVVAKWKHCQFPFDMLGRKQSCRSTPTMLATLKIRGHDFQFRICDGCALNLRLVSDPGITDVHIDILPPPEQ